MARIIIIGSNGQLAHDCIQCLGNHSLCNVDLPEVDITLRASILNVVEAFKPDFIINCAAYTAVDLAESNAARCMSINADGPKILAEVCQQHNIFLFHISTDYVFDGFKNSNQGWTEDESPNPQTIYGESKQLGEQNIVQSCCRYAILRTAWLYGSFGHNFPKTMLKLALSAPERTIRVVNDQYGCPTCATDLAYQIKTLIETPETPVGIFHSVSRGSTTWYHFAKEFLNLMGVSYVLEPCTSADYPTPAKRPANSILQNKVLDEISLCTMPDWKEALARFVNLHKHDLMTVTQAALATKQ